MDLSDPSKGQQDAGQVCIYQKKQVKQGATVTLQCTKPLIGRYVTLIQHRADEPLNFCEMEVMGIPVESGSVTYPTA